MLEGIIRYGIQPAPVGVQVVGEWDIVQQLHPPGTDRADKMVAPPLAAQDQLVHVLDELRCAVGVEVGLGVGVDYPFLLELLVDCVE